MADKSSTTALAVPARDGDGGGGGDGDDGDDGGNGGDGGEAVTTITHEIVFAAAAIAHEIGGATAVADGCRGRR